MNVAIVEGERQGRPTDVLRRKALGAMGANAKAASVALTPFAAKAHGMRSVFLNAPMTVEAAPAEHLEAVTDVHLPTVLAATDVAANPAYATPIPFAVQIPGTTSV